ncbi:NAD(P)-dependent alcohol dehydrogenase [Treponema sp. OMZ 840]|uniref:NAD(P)-dependent alcohol dehydrogenase n=1 Tax=Treponema sp. OMZ 840 TaxID=244313 RepID=UPI003D8A7EF6
MKALVLESIKKLRLREFSIKESMGPYDVRIKVKACGICGSDVHYYTEGAIGDFVVKEPMILGHEAAGVVVEKGDNVTNVEIGDLVCMEPGIPDMHASEVLEGNYHLDPDIKFWATPPIHGCLRETVVHPARFCFKLPKGMSAAEGAMMEPLATGLEAAKKACIEPGDVALVVGCGTIGIMVALAALAGGCAKVFISDVKQEKLNIAAKYANIVPINAEQTDLIKFIMKETKGRGCDRVFEASGNPCVYPEFFKATKRGGKVVLVGMMNGVVKMNVPWIQVRGLSIETLFRYTNEFERAVALVNAGKIDIKPLISKTFSFEEAIQAYEFAAAGHPEIVKVMIELP